MEQIEYVVTIRKFHLSELQRDLTKGTKIFWDGNMVEFAGGERQPAPSFRAAINAGWVGKVSEVGDVQPEAPPAPPTMRREAMDVVYQDQLEVGSATRAKPDAPAGPANRAKKASAAEVQALQSQQDSRDVGEIVIDENDRKRRAEEHRQKVLARAKEQEETIDGIRGLKAKVSSGLGEQEGSEDGIGNLKAKVIPGDTVLQIGDGEEVATIDTTSSRRAKQATDQAAGRRDPEADRAEALAKRAAAQERLKTAAKKEAPKLVDPSKLDPEERAAAKKTAAGKRTIVDSDTVIDEESGEISTSGLSAEDAASRVEDNPYPEDGTDAEKIKWLKEFASKSVLFRVYLSGTKAFQKKMVKAFPKVDFSKAAKKAKKTTKVVTEDFVDPDEADIE